MGAAQRVGLGTFDVHLDVVDFGELQLRHDLVDGGERHLDLAFRPFRFHDHAIRRRVLGVNVHGEHFFLVPHALRVNDNAARLDFRWKIAAQAFQILWCGFDGDNGFRPCLQCFFDCYSNIGAAIEHYIACLHRLLARAVDVLGLFRQIERQHELRPAGNPIGAFRRLPFLVVLFKLQAFGTGEDLVFDRRLFLEVLGDAHRSADGALPRTSDCGDAS